LPANAVAAVDISCGGLVVATGEDLVGMRPCVAAATGKAGEQARRAGFGDHRVWCAPEVDDLARAAETGVVDEPWALVDAPRVQVGGVALPFSEVGGATLHRARRWLGQRIDTGSMELRLIVPTNWGNVRIDKAERAAAAVGLAPTTFRAALFQADALSSSSVRWAYTVELSAKGAVVSLVHRERRTLSLVDTAFVLRVDPDHCPYDDALRDSAGEPGDFGLRVLTALRSIRERHRSARHGSSEILVRGSGAGPLVDLFDIASMPSFPVPSGAVAEAACSLPAARND